MPHFLRERALIDDYADDLMEEYRQTSQTIPVHHPLIMLGTSLYVPHVYDLVQGLPNNLPADRTLDHILTFMTTNYMFFRFEDHYWNYPQIGVW